VSEERPLTEEEIAALRQLLIADQRRVWLVSSLRAIALWIAALSGAYISLKSALMEMLK